MKDIVFTLEFDDDSANSRANDYLEKVGPYCMLARS